MSEEKSQPAVTRSQAQIELEAYTFRELVEHLRLKSGEVQNIDLMNLAGFCRNCLAKWYVKGAKELGVEDVDYESARTIVYGEPYESWKDKHISGPKVVILPEKENH